MKVTTSNKSFSKPWIIKIALFLGLLLSSVIVLASDDIRKPTGQVLAIVGSTAIAVASSKFLHLYGGQVGLPNPQVSFSASVDTYGLRLSASLYSILSVLPSFGVLLFLGVFVPGNIASKFRRVYKIEWNIGTLLIAPFVPKILSLVSKYKAARADSFAQIDKSDDL